MTAAHWVPFGTHPRADSCWSLSAAADGRVYAAACCEHTPGGTAQLLRSTTEGGLELLLDVADAVDDPPAAGRATQCKVHYSLCPSIDGTLYVATHLSAAALGSAEPYHPWLAWHDEATRFRGAALLAVDTSSGEARWWRTLLPGEGCRAMLLDDERQLLYALSYPRDHLVVHDLTTGASKTLGRIGSVNAQVLLLDDAHRVWTSDDDGRLVRYDPGTDRLERSTYVLPHDPLVQDGWHSVLYDGVRDPRTGSFLLSTWSTRPRLLRLWPDDGPFGRVEDLGPATPDRDPIELVDTYTDHCGGLALGPDGALWHVATRWRAGARPGAHDSAGTTGVLVRTDLETLERREVLRLQRPDSPHDHYVSRAAFDASGDLWLGIVSPPPTGVYRVDAPAGTGPVTLRSWG